jgi:hypothetical protein
MVSVTSERRSAAARSLRKTNQKLGERRPRDIVACNTIIAATIAGTVVAAET